MIKITIILGATFAALSAAVWSANWFANAFVFGKQDTDPAFLGALIGSAGTVFAAMIAFTIVIYQNDEQDRRTNELAVISRETAKKAKEVTADALNQGADRLDSLFKTFPDSSSNSPDVWRDKLIDLRNEGKLPQNYGAVATSLVGNEMMDVLARLHQLALDGSNIRVTRIQAHGIPDFRQADWEQMNTSARDAVITGRNLLPRIRAEAIRLRSG